MEIVFSSCDGHMCIIAHLFHTNETDRHCYSDCTNAIVKFCKWGNNFNECMMLATKVHTVWKTEVSSGGIKYWYTYTVKNGLLQ